MRICLEKREKSTKRPENSGQLVIGMCGARITRFMQGKRMEEQLSG
nr:unnamed protein product [Callosobruchus analis]